MQTQYQTRDITLTRARQEASTVFLAKVFNWMAIGLALTGIVAYFFAESGMVRALVGSPLFFILILVELGMVFYLSARVEKMQPATATGLFVGYSVLNGVTLSSIFLAYTQASIATTFLITAGMFAAMAPSARDMRRRRPIWWRWPRSSPGAVRPGCGWRCSMRSRSGWRVWSRAGISSATC